MPKDWNSVSESGSQQEDERSNEQVTESKTEQGQSKQQTSEGSSGQQQGQNKASEQTRERPKFLSDQELIEKIKSKQIEERKKIKIVNCRSEELVVMLKEHKLINYLREMKKEGKATTYVGCFKSEEDLISFIEEKITNKYRFFLHPYIKTARDIEKEKEYEEKRRQREEERGKRERERERDRDREEGKRDWYENRREENRDNRREDNRDNRREEDHRRGDDNRRRQENRRDREGEGRRERENEGRRERGENQGRRDRENQSRRDRERQNQTRKGQNQHKRNYQDGQKRRGRNRPQYDQQEKQDQKYSDKTQKRYQPKNPPQQNLREEKNQQKRSEKRQEKPTQSSKPQPKPQHNYLIEKNQIRILSNIYSKNRIVDDIVELKIPSKWDRIKIYVKKQGLNKVLELSELIWNKIGYGLKALPNEDSKEDFIEVVLEVNCHVIHPNTEFGLLTDNSKKYFDKVGSKNKYIIQKEFSIEEYVKGFKTAQRDICKKWNNWVIKAQNDTIPNLLKLSWKLRREFYLNINIVVGKRGQVPFAVLEIQPESDKEKRPKPDTSVVNNYLN